MQAPAVVTFVGDLLRRCRRGGGSTAAAAPPPPPSSAAARLAALLPQLQRTPQQWRTQLVHAADLQQEIEALQPRPQLSGVWHKDRQASDSMEAACDAVQLSWVLRKALVLLNTLEVCEWVLHEFG